MISLLYRNVFVMGDVLYANKITHFSYKKGGGAICKTIRLR